MVIQNFDQIKHVNMLKSAHRQITQYEQTQKPTFEAAQAYYNVGKLEECEQVVLELQKNDMVTKAVKKLQQNIEIQKLQISEGKYDYKSMVEEAKANFVVKCQNYVNPNIEIREAGKKRFGYFAKSKIEMGTLIMVEKAFVVGSIDQMFEQLQVKNILKDSQVQQYLFLRGGDSSLNQLQNLIQKFDKNGFASFPKLEDELVKHDFQEYDTLIIGSSLFNHSCLSNAFWYFIGDVQFIVTQRDILCNEQITLQYIDPQQSFVNYQYKIEQKFGFMCECNMCQSITKQQTEQLTRLEDILKIKVKSAENKAENNIITNDDIESINNICQRVTNIFDESQAPRNGLSYFYTELAHVCLNHKNSKTRYFDIGIKALECYGIDGEQARIGKLVMKPHAQHFMNFQVIRQLMNMLQYCKFANTSKNEINNWLKVIDLVFTKITGGCGDFKYYLKTSLSENGVK
ncbi:SET_domain-containing protein [Hexamita inflata]|uniref:SET_domain-containing protein n=1 Tax=Hexamita inflata TaxID=28002 RepID=A0ABP1HI79_9EUKA